VEAATLVGMLKGTAYYNPVMNPERALQRRNTVLAMMVKEGKLPRRATSSSRRSRMKLDFERLPEFNGTTPLKPPTETSPLAARMGRPA
jgi:penicillin-binding protein 1A